MIYADSEIFKGGWSDLIIVSQERDFKHFSFDFWNTIAFSNPKFKNERTRYFSKLFLDKFEETEINRAFSEVGKRYNRFIETGGQTKTVNELYECVFQFLEVNPCKSIEEIKTDVFEIFLNHPPLFSEECFTFLHSIDFKSASLSITSNTAFIPGKVIKEYLKSINILNKFSFCLFSDEQMVAKPNSEMFNKLKEKINVEKNEFLNVLHIGDNNIADCYGATQAGLSSFHLISNIPLIHTRNALHTIKDVQSIPFSREDYSKFKFGSHSISEQFGLQLFEYFETSHLDKFLPDYTNIVIYSSPYMHIPTSSFYLTKSFYKAFDQYLVSNRIESVNLEFGKIERCQTYTEDYGELSAEDRFNLIKNDTYKLITIPNKNDLCIFIDDISITGTHQRVIEHLLESSSVETNRFFLYFAKLSNPDVDPSFENYLNYAYINEFYRLIDLINSDDFVITTRTIKLILSQNNELLLELIHSFIKWEKYEVWKDIIFMSYKNGYHKIELYQENLINLEMEFEKFNKFKKFNMNKV